MNNNRCGKNEAIRIFERAGYRLGRNVTYASKNASTNLYWANPGFELLDYGWSLILDDTRRRILYLFDIPAHGIDPEELTSRSDDPERIDLQIYYGDFSFTDSRSKVEFRKFLVAHSSY